MTRKLLEEHLKAYPSLEIQDVFKFLFQSSFGCEHLVSSLDGAIGYISREYAELRPEQGNIEPLDGGYSRVPLSYMDNGLTSETLGKLFFLSARKEENGQGDLKNKLNIAAQLVSEGVFPFSEKDFSDAVTEWERLGFPAVRHSQAFRDNYSPSYRVISNKYIPFLPLLAEIDKLISVKEKVTVAIEGGSASGKSTLGEMLSEIYNCTVFHMDDYFLPPEKRTKERLNEVGGNVDRERFLNEILLPLSRGEAVKYRKFDCGTMSLGEELQVDPERLVIVEGAYSMHPELEKYYDLTVFLDISTELQRERITRRNTPAFATRFFNEWIPLENIYFERTNIKSRCGLIVSVK